MSAAPHVVFVPGGGANGAGETVRSRVLADALRARLPRCRIGFVTEDGHAGPLPAGYERHGVPGRVSRQVAEVNRLLARLAPDLVVFDCRGRGAQIACAARLGARTVYVAAQPHVLRRALRWRRLRSLDEIWALGEGLGAPGGGFTRAQRLRLRLPRSAVLRRFDAIFPPPHPPRSTALRRRLGLGDDSYLLFAPGGGGYRHQGRPVPELFVEAAERCQRDTGTRCAVVLGPLYRGGMRSRPGLVLVDALEPAEMIDLLAGARLAVCGGGALIRQAVTLARPCLAVPAGGSDQPARIRSCAAAGWVEAVELDPDAIAGAAGGLLDEPARLERLAAGARRAGWRNGLPEAVARLEALLEGSPSAASAARALPPE